MTLSIQASEPVARVFYLYGDVADDGQVPSGKQEPFHQMRLADTGPRGMSQFKSALEAVGLEVEEAYDKDFAVNAESLKDIDVLILGSNQRRFSADEAAALRRWVEDGGGVVVWSDSAFGGHFRKVGVDNPAGRDSDNDLVAQFGLFLLTDNGAGNYLVKNYTEPHYLILNQAENSLGFRGEGVSPVRVSPPARMLAPLQEGGLGGKLRVNKRDEPFNPDTDAALAIAEIGKGRVVATFDRNTFWNAGEGTRLSHADNREFAQRLILWAANRENVAIPGGENAEAAAGALTVRAGPDRSIRVGESTRLKGSVSGAEQPEVLWKVVTGPVEAVSFENNNAAALDTPATFNQPGIYTLELQARSGEHSASDQVVIEVKEAPPTAAEVPPLRPFAPEKDLIALHYDHAPDKDDGHSAAADRTLLQSLYGKDWLAKHVVAVSGTYGKNKKGFNIHSDTVMDVTWNDCGGWISAHRDWDSARDAVFSRWLATLKAGGDVYVKEGGQSDFTAQVVARLMEEHPDINTRQRIHVVQHSNFNEQQTEPDALAFTTTNTNYVRITDANRYLRQGGGDASFEKAALENPHTGQAWKAAFEYYPPKHTLDFSDTGELMHILGLGEIGIEEFRVRFLDSDSKESTE